MLSVFVIAGLFVVLILIYLLFVRPWQHRWGATDEEVARPMLGDKTCPAPFA
jgi:type II secretory pathway component PulM